MTIDHINRPFFGNGPFDPQCSGTFITGKRDINQDINWKTGHKLGHKLGTGSPQKRDKYQ